MVSDQSNNLTNLLSQEKTKISREAPMNIGAEQALLGAIISNNLSFRKSGEFLEPDHFSSKINGLIFQTLKKLISNDQIADLNTIKVFLENDQDFISNGGITYLLKISENSISIINSKQYGELIYDLFIRRKLIDLGTNLINDSYDNYEEQNSNIIIENTESNLYNLTNDGDTQKGPKQFDDILSVTVDYAEKAYKKSDDVVGLKTGLNDFDKKIGGLHKSDLIIVAGRPSMGKTAFATNIASNICNIKNKENTTNVLFFSLEMSSEQLATRILSELSQISSERIRTGNLSKNDFEKIIKASEKLKNLSLFIDDSPALTISSIRTRARRLKRKKS